MASVTEQRSVRFSTKKPVEHESEDTGEWDFDDFRKLLRVPLPKVVTDSNYNQFDVHTAASLGVSGAEAPEVSEGFHVGVGFHVVGLGFHVVVFFQCRISLWI